MLESLVGAHENVINHSARTARAAIVNARFEEAHGIYRSPNF